MTGVLFMRSAVARKHQSNDRRSTIKRYEIKHMCTVCRFKSYSDANNVNTSYSVFEYIRIW